MSDKDRGQLKKDDVDVAQQQELDADAALEEGEELREQELANQDEVNRVATEILSETPGFKPAAWLPREHAEALRHLFEAKGAERETIGDGHVSGIERMRSLNLALANLRPMLSAANEHGASNTEQALLGARVAELRLELKQTIYKEAVPRKKRDDRDKADDSGDEDEPDSEDEESGSADSSKHDADDAADAADAADSSEHATDKKGKRSRWKFWQKDDASSGGESSSE